MVGSCAVTEEIDPINAPGYLVSTASYMASMLHSEVIRDMKLACRGLKMIAVDPSLQVLFEDNSILPWRVIRSAPEMASHVTASKTPKLFSNSMMN